MTRPLDGVALQTYFRRLACHDLVSSSGTVNFAHGSPLPDISLVDWRSPSGKESSFFTGLVSRLLQRMAECACFL